MERHVGMMLQDVNLRMFRVLNKRYENLGIEVTPVQSRIIMCIHENNDSICQKDLEQHVCRNKSTLSSILDTMEKNGYIRREDSLKDSRKKMICLTQKSYEIIEILDKDRDFVEEFVCNGITEDEYNSFCKVLDKIKENLERV